MITRTSDAWRFAKAWLFAEIKGRPSTAAARFWVAVSVLNPEIRIDS
jgi:hypothetical protein